MSSLTIVRRIAARPALVFTAMTTPEGIGRWWGPDDGPVLLAETDPRPGGRYRVRFRMQDGTEHESSGEYLEVTPPSRLVMTWCWTEGGHPGERGHESRIEVALRPIDTGTELTFTHSQLIDDESRDGHAWGWGGALDKLIRHFAQEAA